MGLLDHLPISQAIELYYEKHYAMRQCNLERLIHMKQEFPALFDKKIDTEIRGIIQYAKEFQKSDRYKELKRIALQEQFLK